MPDSRSNAEGLPSSTQQLQALPTIYNTFSAHEQVHAESSEHQTANSGSEREPVKSWETFEPDVSRENAIEFMSL